MAGKKQIVCLVLILALSSGAAVSAKVSASAPASGPAPRQFEQLQFEKAYNEDLDYNGENEKIICKQTDVKNDETQKTLTVFINDHIVFKKTLKCEYFYVNLADIDMHDHAQDFFITSKGVSDGCLETFYLQYRDPKLKLIQTITKKDAPKYLDMWRYLFGHVSNDASIQLIATRPIGDAIGDYYCFVPYQLINRKLAVVKTNTYNLTSDSQKYVYKAKKKFVTYKSVYLGAAAAFTVNSGDKVRADKVYVSQEGKCYIRIINSKNMKGWISGSQENLFVKVPIWD